MASGHVNVCRYVTVCGGSVIMIEDIYSMSEESIESEYSKE